MQRSLSRLRVTSDPSKTPSAALLLHECFLSPRTPSCVLGTAAHHRGGDGQRGQLLHALQPHGHRAPQPPRLRLRPRPRPRPRHHCDGLGSSTTIHYSSSGSGGGCSDDAGVAGGPRRPHAVRQVPAHEGRCLPSPTTRLLQHPPTWNVLARSSLTVLFLTCSAVCFLSQGSPPPTPPSHEKTGLRGDTPPAAAYATKQPSWRGAAAPSPPPAGPTAAAEGKGKSTAAGTAGPSLLQRVGAGLGAVLGYVFLMHPSVYLLHLTHAAPSLWQVLPCRCESPRRGG